jgi:hypothetical protein
MKTAFAAVLMLAGIALAAPAHALSVIPSAPGAETSQIVPVANGCGRGWHWNFRLRRCVRN